MTIFSLYSNFQMKNNVTYAPSACLIGWQTKGKLPKTEMIKDKSELWTNTHSKTGKKRKQESDSNCYGRRSNHFLFMFSLQSLRLKYTQKCIPWYTFGHILHIGWIVGSPDSIDTHYFWVFRKDGFGWINSSGPHDWRRITLEDENFVLLSLHLCMNQQNLILYFLCESFQSPNIKFRVENRRIFDFGRSVRQFHSKTRFPQKNRNRFFFFWESRSFVADVSH